MTPHRLAEEAADRDGILPHYRHGFIATWIACHEAFERADRARAARTKPWVPTYYTAAELIEKGIRV